MSSYDQISKDLHSSKENLNWMLGTLEGKSFEWTSGEGGLAELKSEFNGKDTQFGFLSVKAIDDVENVSSTRTKIVQFIVVPPNLKIMKRHAALAARNHQDITAIFTALTVNVDSLDEDMTAKEVAKSLLKAGASHKPTKFDFGSETVNVSDL